jgi:hypothetical protein
MRAKTTLAIGLLTLSPSVMWLAACSGGDNNSGTDSGTGMDSTVDDTGTNMDTGVTDTGVTDTGTGMDSGGGGCNKADSGAQCRQCCRAAHMAGLQALNTAEHTCICAGNKCPQCANNYCSADGGQANNQCNTCGLATLNPDGGACFGPVSTACQMSADCVAYVQCTNGCP